MSIREPLSAAIVLVLVLVVAGCGGTTAVDQAEPSPGQRPTASAGMAGSPADPAASDRTVAVRTVEEGGFAYEPASIEVAAGEVVTFEVTNPGEAVHEFVLGGEDVQAEHAEEMAGMDDAMAHDEPNAISVRPGETTSLTWRFDGPGELLYGCHQPGHYEAGMVGEITVT